MRKFLVAFLFSTSAFANSHFTSLTDLWWNANESGWGVTINHQREVVFLTLFVYDQQGRAQWYTAQGTYQGMSQGALVFTGQTFSVVGPYFGNLTFNPSIVSARQAGTMTLTALTNSATLTYSIDGVTVTKQITRQTFRNDDASGQYSGSTKLTQSGCRAPAVNGTFQTFTNFNFSHAGNSLIFASATASGTCTYSGNWTQQGRTGTSQGTFICNDGSFGNYSAVEIDVTIHSITGRFTASDNFCTSISGAFAAVRN